MTDVAAEPVVDVRDLTYDYPGRRALDRVSFQVARGSIVALVGPNGAGKTTLLACIAALRSPFSGRVRLEGLDTAAEPRECHRRVGYLSDFFGLYDELTARQCLMHAAAMRRVPQGEIPGRIERTARRLAVGEYLDAPAGTLSRGLRQRLGIAQAIIHEPRVLLLDEPASGLDPQARHALSGLMLGLRDEGMTVMVSSHILAELEDYSSEMLMLDGGRLLEHRAVTHDGEVAWLRLELEHPVEGLTRLLTQAGAQQVEVGVREVRLRHSPEPEARGRLLRELVAAGVPVCALEVERTSLQDAYLARLGSRGET